MKLWRSNHNKSNSLIFEIIDKNEKRKNIFLHIPYDLQRLSRESLIILTEIYSTQEDSLISMTRNFLCDLALHSEFSKNNSLPYIFSNNLNGLLTHTNPLINFMGCILASKVEDHFLGAEEKKRYLLALSCIGKNKYNNEKILQVKAATSLLSTSNENSTNKLRKKHQNVLKNILKKQYEGINTDLIRLCFLSENTSVAYAAYACWEQLCSDGLVTESNSLGQVLLQVIDEKNFDKCLTILASLIKDKTLPTDHAEDYLKTILSYLQKKTYTSNNEKIIRSFLTILESTSSDSYFLNHQLTEQISDWLITRLNQYKGDNCIHFIIRGLKKGYWESFGNTLETTIVEQLTKSNPSLSTLFLWDLIKVSTFYASNIKSSSKWATILLKFTENFIEKHGKVWNLFPSFYGVISEISIENLITWREKQQYAQLLEKCSKKHLPEDILKQAHKLFTSHHTKVETLNNSELLIRIIYCHLEKKALNDAIELVDIITEEDYQSHNLQYDTIFRQISEHLFNLCNFNNSLDVAAFVKLLIKFSNNPIVDLWKKMIPTMLSIVFHLSSKLSMFLI